MLSIEISTKVEVNCPYRTGETDKYNVYVEYTISPKRERPGSPQLADLLEPYETMEKGISGEDLCIAVYNDIKEKYPSVRKLTVEINTPYDLPENEKTDARVYAKMTSKKDD